VPKKRASLKFVPSYRKIIAAKHRLIQNRDFGAPFTKKPALEDAGFQEFGHKDQRCQKIANRMMIGSGIPNSQNNAPRPKPMFSSCLSDARPTWPVLHR